MSALTRRGGSQSSYLVFNITFLKQFGFSKKNYLLSCAITKKKKRKKEKKMHLVCEKTGKKLEFKTASKV